MKIKKVSQAAGTMSIAVGQMVEDLTNLKSTEDMVILLEIQKACNAAHELRVHLNSLINYASGLVVDEEADAVRK